MKIISGDGQTAPLQSGLQYIIHIPKQPWFSIPKSNLSQNQKEAVFCQSSLTYYMTSGPVGHQRNTISGLKVSYDYEVLIASIFCTNWTSAIPSKLLPTSPKLVDYPIKNGHDVTMTMTVIDSSLIGLCEMCSLGATVTRTSSQDESSGYQWECSRERDYCRSRYRTMWMDIYDVAPAIAISQCKKHTGVTIDVAILLIPVASQWSPVGST